MKLLRIFATWALGASVLAVLLSAALPLAFGAKSLVVQSGSMTPTIRTGDVVVVRPIAPKEAKVGEIVTFKDPDGSHRLLVHRVRAVSFHDLRYWFVTQGDANTTREHWSVAATGTIGRVVYRVPLLGFVAGWINSPPGRIGLLILPATLLAVSLLARIWRGRPEHARE